MGSRTMTKRPKRVQAPEGCADYITAGKIYDVVGFWGNWDETYGHGFQILHDNGGISDCSERMCAYLNDQDWIIVETED
jgi:hypothetical protein